MNPIFALTAPMVLIVTTLAAVQWLMPRLTRRGLWFVVTVSPTFPGTPEARRIERGYRLGVVLAGTAGIGLSALALAHPAATPFGLLAQLLVGTAAFLRARHQVLPHAIPATAVREAALRRPPTRLHSGLQLGPFLLLAGVATWLAELYGSLPARVPLHWDIRGDVDRWADKSVGAVFGPTLSGAGLCVAIWFLGRMVGRSRHLSATGSAAQTEETFRRRMKGILLASEYFVAFSFALTAIPMTGRGPVRVILAAPALAVLFVVGLFVLTIRTGQGGSRLAPAGDGFGDRTADAHWKWGLVYVNRDDPAILVEKRFGVGYTLNFARPGAWALIGLLAALPALVGLIASLAR